ncbi:glycan biosynthesis hexose transferase WsfD [Leifsonia sp. 22587]|uniref:glycan biosynthesis hexose transferase WsfD n=1 Tax=Leifsonia sp. 22587 TaxID=3453946 RepID=UPI003F82B351
MADGLLSCSIAIVAMVAALLRVAVPSFQGQAPHPDGDRYLCQLGWDAVVPTNRSAPRYWDFALFEWSHNGLAPTYPCTPYPSSEVWLLKALQWFSSTVSSKPGTLDFHWLVLTNAVLVGVLVGLFAYAATGMALWARVLLSAVIFGVLSDPIFASYAAGPMGEYVGLVGIALLAVGVVFYSSNGRRMLGTILVGIGGLLMITSKVQAITLLIPLAAFLLVVPLERRGKAAPVKPEDRVWSRAIRFVGRRLVGAVLVAVFAVGGGWMLANNPKEFQQINPWELISVGVLGHSSTPAQDVKEMGFPESMAKYAGKTAGDENSIMFTPEWKQYASLMNYGTVATFLLHHPDRVWPLIDTGASDFFAARPSYLGAFEPGRGEAQANSLSLLALAGSGVTGFFSFAFAGVIAFGGAILGVRRSQRGTPSRGFANAALLMASFTVVQFGTAIFGEAIENSKHLVFAVLASALVIPFVVSSFALRADDNALPPERPVPEHPQPERPEVEDPEESQVRPLHAADLP